MMKGFCACGDHVWAPLTRGFITMVSPRAAALLNKKWFAKYDGKNYYAARTDHVTRKTVRLHTVLCEGSFLVDHRSRNTLDNRDDNLRQATYSQNAMNRKSRRRKEGLPRGVRRSGPGFQARITIEGRLMVLGSYPSIEAAAAAYDSAARLMHRDFAVLNGAN